MVKSRPFFSVFLICVFTIFLTACQKISLSDNKHSSAPGSGPASGSSNAPAGHPNSSGQPGGNAAVVDATPYLNGSWDINFQFNEQNLVSSVQFSSQGNNTFTGEGADQTGAAWSVANGQIAGAEISFDKVYMGKPPINYAGGIGYDPELGVFFHGQYSIPSTGGSGEWLAVRPKDYAKDPIPAWAQQVTAEQESAKQAELAPAGQGEQEEQAISSDAGSSIAPRDLSGKYAASYKYQFKKVLTKMWLKHDGAWQKDKPNITGDGVDTSTGEKFEVKGWYKHPDIKLIRIYKKDKGAQSSRDVTFQGKVLATGADIAMDGENSLGSHWDAKLIR